jgi:hypothetical protein
VSTLEPIDVARLREAWALRAAEPGRASDPERIFDALHGNLSAEERRAVVDEIVLDADAAEAWRLARELAPQPAAAAAWRWMSMAAAALLVVALGWQVVDRSGPLEEPAYRSVEERGIVSALPPETVLPRAQPVLRWIGVDGARYRVRVLTPELELLDETGELIGQAHTLSADVLRRIPAGGRILWQVEGRLPEGAVIVSPTFSVRVE